MEFFCFGSGSSGNAYIVRHNGECILLECGIDYKKLCNKIMMEGISLTEIKAVICTHQHKDHTASLSHWLDRGIKVVAPASCFTDSIDNCIVADNGSKLDLTENIRVLAFSVNHDCQALGYVLYFKDTKESLLFINDTYYFDFEYKNLAFDYVFIECNHLRNMLEVIKNQCVENGKSVAKYERQEQFHMSLAALKKFLATINLSKTKSIHLMHMSYECCNSKICKEVIENTFKIKTYVCCEYGGIL